MLKEIIAQAGQAVHWFFDRQETNRAARRAHWLQRRSKLDGEVFLKTVVLGWIQHPRASLNQLCQTSHDLGVAISPQGLDERMTEDAVRFLQERLAQAMVGLQARRQRVAEALVGFSEVYFQDSTVIALPAGLHTLFAGVGGAASAAAVKLHLLFGFLSGSVIHLAWTAGRAPDQGYAEHVDHLLRGSLLIQDLGFFQLATFQRIAQRGAFFLTRWRHDCCLFLESAPQKALDMLPFLQAQVQVVEHYAVRMGRQFQLPVQMICVQLPHAVAAERRRKLIAAYRRRGNPLSERLLALCDWNIFLTNLPPERLSLRQVLVCYTLRWQVELIFKLWKSQAALAHLAGLRKERVLCELYAKMIGLVLTHFLVAPLRFLLIEQQIEISAPKARQVIEDRIAVWLPLLGGELAALETELEDLAQRILHFARKTRRKTHLASLDRLLQADQLEIAQLYPLA